jgi:hypothetical protein
MYSCSSKIIISSLKEIFPSAERIVIVLKYYTNIDLKTYSMLSTASSNNGTEM